jgi:hypothetical protein
MALDELEVFIGDWDMAIAEGGEGWPEMPPVEEQLASSAATVSFEWMDGKELMVQRWNAPDPGPDGLAVIGPDPENEGDYLQHYFDQRGVARIYRMSFGSGTWKLWRDEPDFSPLDFKQRWEGKFSGDGNRLEGTWDINQDGDWRKDFAAVWERAS